MFMDEENETQRTTLLGLKFGGFSDLAPIYLPLLPFMLSMVKANELGPLT